MDWNDKEVQNWVCEQIGVEYKGLPLTHAQRSRFLALKNKKPFLEFKPLAKRKLMYPTPKEPQNQNDSSLTENALIGQYDREIADLEQKEDKYKKMMADIRTLRAALVKKRKAIAAILAPVGTILCLTLSGCGGNSDEARERTDEYYLYECTEHCANMQGRLTRISFVPFIGYGNSARCTCSFETE